MGARRVGSILLAVVAGLFVPGVRAGAETETFYLGTDGFPRGSLAPNVNGGELPNFDLGRDIHPGLLLKGSWLGLEETDETRYQQWDTPMGEVRLSGYPTLTIWAAVSGFEFDQGGALSAFLLDCTRFGHPCEELARGEAEVGPGEGGWWSEQIIHFPPLDHHFEADRRLAVRVVADAGAGADMMIAFGYPAYRSRLTVSSSPPPSQPSEEAVVAAVVDPEPPPPGAGPITEVGDDLPDEGEAGWFLPALLNGLLLAGLGLILIAWLPRPRRPRRGRHQPRAMGRGSQQHS